MEEKTKVNPLGSLPIPKLLVKFAIPSIMAMLVLALYNIVDQLFIGNMVGTNGNAATNVAFPLSSCCIALALMFGIGGAANFNLNMGRGNKEKAIHYIGNAISMLILSGVVLAVITKIFLRPLMILFGSPAEVLPYAVTYVSITAIGFPFAILQAGGSHLIRADGSPTVSMICSLTGCIINTVLDALFVVGFEWGMAGAAWATVIGQVVSSLLVLNYLRGFKTVHLPKADLIPQWKYVKDIVALGIPAFANQIAMLFVQIIMNNSLRYYGALSVYGEAIPLACCGIVMKVNQVYFSIVIGLSQSCQPILSFNYGARKFDRVKKAFFLACAASVVMGAIATIVFQTLPYQILRLFGDNTQEYFDFGIMFFRIFLAFTILNGVQAIASTMFTAIGKPKEGIFVSLSRQVILFIPLSLILPLFMQLYGLVYTAPVTDLLAFVITSLMVMKEFRKINRMQQEDLAAAKQA